MCTAVTYKTKDFYFGRTLDYEFSYGEEVTITPRNYPLSFRHMGTVQNHFAMIGMAHVVENVPLYYDAVNEKGLAMAGLNFVGFADYNEPVEGKDNIAHFEFIPWIMGQCDSVRQARTLIERINLTNVLFSDTLPVAQLHWIIADCHDAITVESVKEGIRVYDNAPGVLTNNPPFDEQMFQLRNFMKLSTRDPENSFSSKLDLRPYSRGMGALGLPGDLSSQSRFVRAAFVKLNSVSGDTELESVNQFFHILSAVEQQRGCCEVGEGKFETTIYTSCCNADKGIYYYTTYDNHQISAVNMHRENPEGRRLIRYPLIRGEKIYKQN
ncbi:MAG: choloylglycine hydrolase family protein [Ruminococcaceae bacterium]|nr:choloylglycine hydrolase family protein [Oscillospiraceae bacterium]